MPEQLYPWMHLVGRILFCMVFIGSGMNHLTQSQPMAQYAAAKGVPGARPAVILTGLMMLAGAVMILLGWNRAIGAWLLVVFLVPTAFMMHAFWREDDPMVKQNEMAHFMKNLALAGAAMLIAFYANSPWPMSLGG